MPISNALVGLLTPELGLPDLLIHLASELDNGHSERANLVSLGHSGGAVPEFALLRAEQHRSSLFVGREKASREPTTNARKGGESNKPDGQCQKGEGKELGQRIRRRNVRS